MSHLLDRLINVYLILDIRGLMRVLCKESDLREKLIEKVIVVRLTD